ncbi:MAG TPA: hypothetical protein VHZ24_17595 [Pirellulales bacterium]|jgi:hypothetical protein|nr:hypothetical protein [Pirellulales bacterium]
MWRMLAVMVLLLPRLAHADPAFTVRQAIDAHGGAEALRKYPAFTAKMRGTMTMSGAEVPFTGNVAMQVPGKYRLEINLELAGQKVSIVQVVNGDAVSQTAGGIEIPLGDAMRSELKQMALMQELTMLTSLNDAKRFTLKEEKTGDKRATIIAVRAKGMKDVKMFFDNKTGLLVKMQRQAINPEMRMISEDTLLDGYQSIQGVMVPLRSSAMHDGKPFMNLVFSDYQMLEKLDDATFK